MKYDEAEIKAIKKDRCDVFDVSNSFGHFEAFWTLEQNVVFYYKKRLKTLLDFGPHLLPVLALVETFRNTLYLSPNKFLSHFELGNTKKIVEIVARSPEERFGSSFSI